MLTLTGQWKRLRLELHSVTLGSGKTAPRLDRHDGTGAPPRARHLPATRTAPGHTLGVQSSGAPSGIGDEQLAVGSLEEEERVAAREEACRRRRSSAGGAGTPSRPRRGSILRRQACAPLSATPTIASNVARPRAAEMPAHSANDSAVVGPNTCRKRRASSLPRVRGSIAGGGTVHIVGWHTPSHRISSRPVGAA